MSEHEFVRVGSTGHSEAWSCWAPGATAALLATLFLYFFSERQTCFAEGPLDAVPCRREEPRGTCGIVFSRFVCILRHSCDSSCVISVQNAKT